MKIILPLFILVIITIMSGCKHTVQYDCSGYTPTYADNVKPILDVTCAASGCHGGGEAEAGIDLSTYSGAADASRKNSFMGSIQHKPLYKKMPPDADMLTDSQIHLLYCWTQNGSPE
jgi:hypothetical protein